MQRQLEPQRIDAVTEIRTAKDIDELAGILNNHRHFNVFSTYDGPHIILVAWIIYFYRAINGNTPSGRVYACWDESAARSGYSGDLISLLYPPASTAGDKSALSTQAIHTIKTNFVNLLKKNPRFEVREASQPTSKEA